MSTTSETPPIKPRRLATRIEQQGDMLTLDLRDSHWGVGIFLSLWLIGWTVGCVGLLWGVLTQREPFLILFAIPFWVSWIFVAAMLVNIFFGRHRLILDSDGLVHQRHALLPLSWRQIPLHEIRKFQVQLFNVDNEGGSTTGIEMTTLGRSLTFGTNLSALERTWLAHRLNEHCHHLRRQEKVTNLGDGDLADCRNCLLPTDSSWSVREENIHLGFQQQGKFNLATVVGLAFINGFWNGIVGVFIGALLGLAPGNPMPAEIGWWGLFLFLLPFEAIGLAMLIGLLLALVEPFRVTRWIVAPDAIEQVTTRFGLSLGRHRHYPCDGLASATIRDDLESGWWKFSPQKKTTTPTGDHYGLLLASADHHEICSIRGLTLGEARWMKGRLQERGTLRL